MAEESFQEKTEQPTPKKLEKAKQEGNVPKSSEVSSALILMTSLAVFIFLGSWMFWSLSSFMGGVLKNAGTLSLDESSLFPFVTYVLSHVFKVLLPLMLTVLIAGVIGNVVQFGFVFSSKPFVPNISKLSPISGLKKLLSLKSLVEVIKALCKFAFVSVIAYIVLRSEMNGFPDLMAMGISSILAFIGKVAMEICLYVCMALMVLAVLDFVYQRWQHRKNLRMTKQEVKDEAKQSEGDPKVKGRIKQIQLETARRRMMAQVPNADVVITNPTHLAIALKYKHEKMVAPQVIAKGADYIALKIREIAEKNGIPVVENKPLARTLYKTVELNGYIPVNIYKAVAEILAYVYRLKQKKDKIY